MAYADWDKEKLAELQQQINSEYAQYCAKGLALNMARGKPAADQLALSEDMPAILREHTDFFSEAGADCRNYSTLEGLPEAQRLMACLLDDSPDNILVGGNSSLTLMYTVVSLCMDFGSGSSAAWRGHTPVKWICPVPGYDRHFGISQAFGMDMIPVAMNENGPDMDEVERIAASDDRVKGIWCVPKYANPSGVTYSDAVVRRLAAMPCAADDFRIFWDNAYAVHHLYDNPDQQDVLLDIARACEQAGNPNRYYKFASTSKVTLPGAGIAALATSPNNLAYLKKRIGVSAICFDKLNQLRHVKFLKDAQGIADHMSKHAALLRPKFDLVAQKLSTGLAEVGCCSWSHPRGGYFVSFDAPHGCAQRIVQLAREAGVVMTDAGATWPQGADPYDSNIRIAPTMPPLEELSEALDVFVCCVKRAYVETLLAS